MYPSYVSNAKLFNFKFNLNNIWWASCAATTPFFSTSNGKWTTWTLYPAHPMLLCVVKKRWTKCPATLCQFIKARIRTLRPTTLTKPHIVFISKRHVKFTSTIPFLKRREIISRSLANRVSNQSSSLS